MKISILTERFHTHYKPIACVLIFFLLLGTASPRAKDAPKKKITIDVMVFYSPGAAEKAQGNIETLIDHKIAVINKIYTDSRLDIPLRKVHIHKISTSDTATSHTILYRMTRHEAEFSNIPALRTRYGADMVIMLHPYANGGICGLA